MNKSKPSPQDILRSLQQANPNATVAELKKLMWDELQGSPQLAESIFDELFDLFLKETGYRGDRQNGLKEFEAWLKRPNN